MTRKTIEKEVKQHFSNQPEEIRNVILACTENRKKHKERNIQGKWYEPLVKHVQRDTGFTRTKAEQTTINTFLDAYKYYSENNLSYKERKGYTKTTADIEAYFATAKTAQLYAHE